MTIPSSSTARNSFQQPGPRDLQKRNCSSRCPSLGPNSATLLGLAACGLWSRHFVSLGPELPALHRLPIWQQDPPETTAAGGTSWLQGRCAGHDSEVGSQAGQLTTLNGSTHPKDPTLGRRRNMVFLTEPVLTCTARRCANSTFALILQNASKKWSARFVLRRGMVWTVSTCFCRVCSFWLLPSHLRTEKTKNKCLAELLQVSGACTAHKASHQAV